MLISLPRNNLRTQSIGRWPMRLQMHIVHFALLILSAASSRSIYAANDVDTPINFNYPAGALAGYADVVYGSPEGVTLPSSGYDAGSFPIPDYDDLVELPPAFTSLTAGAMPGAQAADVMGVIWLDEISKSGRVIESSLWIAPAADPLLMPVELWTGIEGGGLGPRSVEYQDEPNFPRLQPFTPNRQHHSIGLLFGVRVIETRAVNFINANGGVLSSLLVDLNVENHIVGPQAGIVWAKSHGPISAEMKGLALLGYNSARVTLDGSVAKDLVPGRFNHPLYLSPTSFDHVATYHEFSPSGELCMETKLQVSRRVSLKLAWTGLLINNFLLTGNRIKFQLPSFGLLDPGGGELFLQSVYGGMEMRY